MQIIFIDVYNIKYNIFFGMHNNVRLKLIYI